MSDARRDASRGHVLITGTGRAGTTLLVQYFTALGFDTGFSSEEAAERVDPISHAGLEHQLSRGSLPYVTKSPQYANRLAEVLDEGALTVRACIVPIRELYAAAESRRRVSELAEGAGRDPHKQRGGLSFHARGKPGRQEEVLALQLYRLLHACATHEVPTYLLEFPRFAEQPDHLFRALRPLLEAHGVSEGESRAAHAAVVAPTLINDFRATETPTDP